MKFGLVTMLKSLKNYVRMDALQDECKRIGVNLITAGIVGIFINHFVGSEFSTMFWASTTITSLGAFFLFLGIVQRNKKP